MISNVRKIALAILCEQEAAGKYVNLALSSHKADGLSGEEMAFLTALVYTAVERRLKYDYYISAISQRDAGKIDPYTKNILRLGMCQIFDMHSIPDFAAVNETVKLARNSGERSFVNGVLRSAVRRKEDPPMPPEEKNYKRYLSVKYSFPLWIVKELDALYGREMTERTLRFFNEEKYTDITVNTTKISVVDYSKKLAEIGIDHAPDPNTGISIRIKSSVNPERLPGFADGLFFVQDRASLISACALDAEAGDLVVDTCACPGGKSFATAILTADKARIHSFDLHSTKLPLIVNGAARLGIGSISVAERDALCPDPALISRADRVICDAPCSGMGVLGKKADLRYKSREDVDELPELQYSILSSAKEYLKDGGTLTYSTCTLRPEENGEVVDRFLSENNNFSLCDFEVGEYRSVDGRLTLLPGVHGTDGFFVAKLVKGERK